MAKALARLLGGPTVEVYSAGSNLSGAINPKAIGAMREFGYDLLTHGSKPLDGLPHVQFDFVATMGCGGTCPFILARKRTDWALPDPKHMSPEEYGGVRDEIRDQARLQNQLAEARRNLGQPMQVFLQEAYVKDSAYQEAQRCLLRWTPLSLCATSKSPGISYLWAFGSLSSSVST
jgi:protein-tyrosine-phosphatase